MFILAIACSLMNLVLMPQTFSSHYIQSRRFTSLLLVSILRQRQNDCSNTSRSFNHGQLSLASFFCDPYESPRQCTDMETHFVATSDSAGVMLISSEGRHAGGDLPHQQSVSKAISKTHTFYGYTSRLYLYMFRS
jgi:hypothetical protein